MFGRDPTNARFNPRRRGLVGRAAFAVLLLGLTLGCGAGSALQAGQPGLPAAWKSYALTQGQALKSIDPDAADVSDLSFLGPVLQDRRIVALGERGHGVAEFSQAKIRLVKYLHEQLGYDVLAFESSLLSCYMGDESMSELDPTNIMRNSVFSVWSTADVAKLFAYIQSTRRTPHPLTLAGFDIQVGTEYEVASRPAIFRDLVATVDPGYAQQVYDMDAAFTRNFHRKDWIRANAAAFKPKYDALANFLDVHMSELQQTNADRPLFPMAVRQAAWGMIAYLDQLYASATNREATAYNLRDAAMAINLGVLADRMYPGKKIIVWAHNAHVQRDRSAVRGDKLRWTNMGHWLAQRYGGSLYTIGLFMYQGMAAHNDRKLYTITPAPGRSMEALAHSTGADYVFLDLAHPAPGDGAAWMSQPFTVRDWGNVPLTLVPRDQYDGVLMIDTVHPPQYL